MLKNWSIPLCGLLMLGQAPVGSLFSRSVLSGCVLSGSVLYAAETVDLSAKLKGVSLSNQYGKQVSLDEFSEQPILVLAFLGTQCPLAKLYGPRLVEVQNRFQSDGVVILGINSNTQDSLSELGAYVNRYQINFPMLKDVGNRLADTVGATRTPEVIVLDAQRQVRYHGRIDDQYGVGVARDKPKREDLQIAIEELLAGKSVTLAETQAVGCYIGRAKKVEPSGDITFNKHIAPLLNKHCVECHRQGEIGPFTLTKYEDVLGWEDTILEVVADNRMPPWNANPEFGHFQNDPRLSETERELLKNWVAAGMPQGDPADLPEPPQFVTGWRIPEPEQVIFMRDAAFEVPAEGVVDYQRYVVDPGWDEDKYVVAAEARPDNREVVHHILVYVLSKDSRGDDLRQVLVGYAPGSLPRLCDEGVALKVPAGSQLLFEMHYTPNGSPQSDRSYVGLRFTDAAKVSKLLRGGAAIEREFEIPAGAAEHSVTATYRSRSDEQLISMTPHMHLRGKAFRYEAHYPDGTQEVLLDVPNYDFNWQLKYILAEPKMLKKGTRIVCTAVYDNSEDNPANPDPSQPVKWGDQSSEEMMIGFLDTIPAN